MRGMMEIDFFWSLIQSIEYQIKIESFSERNNEQIGGEQLEGDGKSMETCAQMTAGLKGRNKGQENRKLSSKYANDFPWDEGCVLPQFSRCPLHPSTTTTTNTSYSPIK
jgi:hypothetical protein